jgi:hypothetical protein
MYRDVACLTETDNHPGCSQEKEAPSMCDYSLQNVASRPAKVGDKLVTTPFGDSITRGFAAAGEPNVAVCLLPGTEVAFENEIEFEGGPGLFATWKRTKRIGEMVARFRQVNLDQLHAHHDALEFPNGEFVLLTRLCDGQFATVLQLPAAPRTAAEAEEQKRIAVVA